MTLNTAEGASPSARRRRKAAAVHGADEHRHLADPIARHRSGLRGFGACAASILLRRAGLLAVP
jgi:hypothetical protein